MGWRSVTVAAALVAACGGKAVIDDPLGAGGDASSTSSSTPSSSTSSASPSGSSDCRQSGCAPGFVCQQSTGACLEQCEAGSLACSLGYVCNPCATESCPGCGDCVAACVPPGSCITHEDCAPSEWCVFGQDVCAKRCGTGLNADTCGEGGVCQQCITSSCPTCDDCLSACG